MEASRVEVMVLCPNALEARLYDSMEDERYRSWKIPMFVATVIAYWWQDMGIHGTPEKGKRFGRVAISMSCSGLVDIKELDTLGHPKPAGWSLPDTTGRPWTY